MKSSRNQQQKFTAKRLRKEDLITLAQIQRQAVNFIFALFEHSGTCLLNVSYSNAILFKQVASQIHKIRIVVTFFLDWCKKNAITCLKSVYKAEYSLKILCVKCQQ